MYTLSCFEKYAIYFVTVAGDNPHSTEGTTAMISSLNLEHQHGRRSPTLGQPNKSKFFCVFISLSLISM